MNRNFGKASMVRKCWHCWPHFPPQHKNQKLKTKRKRERETDTEEERNKRSSAFGFAPNPGKKKKTRSKKNKRIMRKQKPTNPFSLSIAYYSSF